MKHCIMVLLNSTGRSLVNRLCNITPQKGTLEQPVYKVNKKIYEPSYDAFFRDLMGKVLKLSASRLAYEFYISSYLAYDMSKALQNVQLLKGLG